MRIQPGPFGILFLFLLTMGFAWLFAEAHVSGPPGSSLDLTAYMVAVGLAVVLYYLARLVLGILNPLNWYRLWCYLRDR